MSSIFQERLYVDKPDTDVFYHPTLLNSTSPICEQHWHDYYELLLITEGSLIYNYQGVCFTAQEGDILCINPNDIHALYLHPDCHVNWHDCLHIHPSLVQKLGFSPKGLRMFPLIRKTETVDYYRRVVNAFCHKRNRDPAACDFRIHSEAMALMGVLFENYSYVPTVQKNYSEESIAMIKQLLSYIQNHLSEPITLDTLSKEVNFSKPYICRAVRAYMNTTVVELINSLRCQYAQRLLLRERISVSECATRSGFNTLSYFSHIYCKHIGEYPSATRKKAMLSKQ